ncbi:MAG: hypothetical protein EZS28_007857, partial [Streblomastix strix]
MYTPISKGVFHVKDPCTPFAFGCGDDNVGCGHNQWPCKYIEYALDQYIYRHPIPEDQTRKVGIMSNYTMSRDYTLRTVNDERIEIQNELCYNYTPSAKPYTNDSTVILSNIVFTSANHQFITQRGQIAFKLIHFMIESGSSNAYYLIKGTTVVSFIEISECQMSMAGSTTSISRGLVESYHGFIWVDKLIAKDITIAGGPIFKSNSTSGWISISNSSFENIERTDSGGSVIQRVIQGSQDGVNIRTSTFTNCTTSSGYGGAIFIQIASGTQSKFEIISESNITTNFSKCSAQEKGGAIYLDLAIGKEQNFDLRGTSFADDNNATHGKSLFINAQGDLRIAVPENQGYKIAAWNDTYEEANLDNLMGYDNSTKVKSVEIPLYYMYTPVAQQVFHVDINTATISGNNNVGCGHVKWPCETIDYALAQCAFRHPIISGNVRKIGIISGYIVNQTYTFTTINEDRIEIQNSLDQSNQTTNTISNMIITNSGKFIINKGTVLFKLIKFQIQSGSSTEYVIKGDIQTPGSNSIVLNEIQIHMETSATSISRGFVQIDSGNLTLDKITVENITSPFSFIKLSSTAKQVNITNSSFTDITRQGNGNGNLIDAQVKGNSLGLRITDCNITKLSNVDGNGGALYLDIGDKKLVQIQNTIFTECKAKYGGSIYTIITGAGNLTINQTSSFNKCESQQGDGGAIYALINESSNLTIKGDKILGTQCIFTECKSNGKNGGGIYAEVGDNSVFNLNETLITLCEAIKSNSLIQSGFGGAIFLTIKDDYNVSNLGVNLKEAKFNDNKAENGGLNLFIVTTKLNQLCLLQFNLNKGEYLKGNYTDINTNENELEGVNLTLSVFDTQSSIDSIQFHQQYLRRYWTPPIPPSIPDPVIEPGNKLWYVLYIHNGSYKNKQGRDIYGCGWVDDPCRSIEFCLQEVTWRIGGNGTAFIENKTIMITGDGYDLIDTIKLNETERRCKNLRIMKVLYGDELHAMTGQAEIMIKKDNNASKETNQQGWMYIFKGMNVSIQGINITADSSIFIPAIFISDQNTTVKLEEVIVHDITFQPQIPQSKGPRGIIQIDLNVKDVYIFNCSFNDIMIEGQGGSALRIQNFTDAPPIIPPLILPLPHPNPDTSINITINETSFSNIQSTGDISNRGGAAIYAEIGDNGSLIIEKSNFTSCIYNENDGGGIYVILNKTALFETRGEVLIEKCETIEDSNETQGGRGGGIYIYTTEESTFNFTIGEKTIFIDNKASICGRDIFVYCRNINILNISERLLFDIYSQYDQNNAVYGTEYKDIDELYHIPLIDYDLLLRFIDYSNDTMYISSRKWGGMDSISNGGINATCNSFEYAVLKQTTPDRTPTNLQSGSQIVYTYISVGEMHVNQPYKTEADIFILRGATTDEISVATERGSVYFDENGEMEFSDQAYWQTKKDQIIDQSDIKGVNQSIILLNINIVLPTTKQARYVLKLVGTKDYVDKGRNIELLIENCTFTQNNTLDKATNFSLLRTEPFLSLRMNISIFNFIGYNASIEGTGLIEINYEPDV